MKDLIKHEQLSIAFKYVYHGKTVERFVGYTLAADLSAKSLANYIIMKMTELELDTDFLISLF